MSTWGNEHMENIPGSCCSPVFGKWEKEEAFPITFPTPVLGRGATAILVLGDHRRILQCQGNPLLTPCTAPSSSGGLLAQTMGWELSGVVGAGSEWQDLFSSPFPDLGQTSLG